jgi:hypothetical protein
VTAITASEITRWPKVCRFCTDPDGFRINLHRRRPPAGASQANFVRLMNSQAEKKSLSHALYPSSR